LEPRNTKDTKKEELAAPPSFTQRESSAVGRTVFAFVVFVVRIAGIRIRNLASRTEPDSVLLVPHDGSLGWAKIKNGHAMKYGARNQITAKVTSVKSDQIMSLVKFEVTTPTQMASVLTTESVQDLGLKVGDTVQLVIKAIHVLPVKE
jgi:molybdate transport system regulatory protein